jgi:hypothetical protein
LGISKFGFRLAILLFTGWSFSCLAMTPDEREWVDLPEPMRQHMLANMRDHLVVVHQLIALLAQQDWQRAGELAESRLGMSSLDDHGARHMAGHMPEGMRQAGTRMHRAASQFALRVEEGETSAAYAALAEVTAACVSCHAAYRVR